MQSRSRRGVSCAAAASAMSRGQQVVGTHLGARRTPGDREGLHAPGHRFGQATRRRVGAPARRNTRVGHQRVGDDRPHAGASISPARRRVPGVDDERAAEGAVLACHADARDVDAHRSHEASAGPFTGRPAMIGLTPTTRSAPGHQRVEQAGGPRGSGRSRCRCSDTRARVGIGDGFEHTGRRANASAAPSKRTPTPELAVLPHEPFPAWRARRRGGDAVAHAVVGHRSRRGRAPTLRFTRAVASLRGALTQQPGAEEVVRGPVAEAEPGVLAVAGEGVDGGNVSPAMPQPCPGFWAPASV